MSRNPGLIIPGYLITIWFLVYMFYLRISECHDLVFKHYKRFCSPTIFINWTAHFKNCKTIVGILTFPLTWRHLVVKTLIYIFKLFIYSAQVLIRHLWQLKTVTLLLDVCYMLSYEGKSAVSFCHQVARWSQIYFATFIWWKIT